MTPSWRRLGTGGPTPNFGVSALLRIGSPTEGFGGGGEDPTSVPGAAGMPCVVALMGCSLSVRQEELLREHFREVVLLLDGDRAGRAAGAAIAERLVSKVSTRLVEISAGSQPDQLGADQIRCLCIPGYF